VEYNTLFYLGYWPSKGIFPLRKCFLSIPFALKNTTTYNSIALHNRSTKTVIRNNVLVPAGNSNKPPNFTPVKEPCVVIPKRRHTLHPEMCLVVLLPAAAPYIAGKCFSREQSINSLRQSWVYSFWDDENNKKHNKYPLAGGY